MTAIRRPPFSLECSLKRYPRIPSRLDHFLSLVLGSGRSLLWPFNKLSGQLVNVDAPKIVKLLTARAENAGSSDDRDMNALAVEDIPVHGSRSIEAFLEVVPIDRRVLQAAPC